MSLPPCWWYLETMTLEERKEVLALLDVRVYVLDQSRTPALRITGTVADIGLTPNTEGGQRYPGASAPAPGAGRASGRRGPTGWPA